MKFITLLAFAVIASFAKVITLPATAENIAKFEQIIDIRTPGEWRDTGVIKGAKTITLVQDKALFWAQISSAIDTTKPFALICRSGNRSNFAANLIDARNLQIINLDGGMNKLIKAGFQTEEYK